MKIILKHSLRIFFLVLGTIFLALGILGLILPVMPGTIFFILAAICYIRSSEKMYNHVINNKYVGHHVLNFLEKRAISSKGKYFSLSFMWASIIFSVIFTAAPYYVKLILLATAIMVSTYILSLNNLEED